MKLTSRSLASFFAMCITTTAAWAAQPASMAVFDTVNAEFEAAMAAGSSSRLAAVYTTDGQLLPPNSPIVSGGDEIRAFWQGALDSGVACAELDTVELDQLGDTAIEVGLYRLKTPDGTPADNGKYIVIWKKENGKWKWHRDMWSSSKGPQ